MELLRRLFHTLFPLTADKLNEFVSYVGTNNFYLVLFAIIFAETGFVVTPFLPGDSLLFALGAIGADPKSPISLPLAAALLAVAAVVGDAVNYAIGYRLGPRVFSREDSKLLNKKHLIRAQEFYDKYGGKTIILARFVPVVRTFAPFVAGVGRMNYLRFLAFNVIGGVAWVLLCISAGYFMGSWEFVRKHFELVIVAIVLISVLPIVIEYLRARRAPKAASPPVAPATPEPAER